MSTDGLPKEGDAKQPDPKQSAPNPDKSAIETAADKIIAALTRFNRANRKGDNAEYERNHTREQRRFVIEKVEIFLIAVYCVATLYECQVFHAESHTMEQEFQASKLSNSNQLIALQAQADEMRQNTEVGERAWVYAELQNDDMVLEGTNYVFYVTVKNTGKTAALCTGSCLRAALDVNQIPRFDQEVTGGEACLAPDETFKLPQTVPSILVSYTGLNPVYLYGTVFYKDIFGNKHWTQFCYSITHGGVNSALLYCHSLTDDIEKVERANNK
jgi:hypothetical protein